MPRVNKPRAGADSEKITIDLGFVDLGPNRRVGSRLLRQPR